MAIYKKVVEERGKMDANLDEKWMLIIHYCNQCKRQTKEKLKIKEL